MPARVEQTLPKIAARFYVRVLEILWAEKDGLTRDALFGRFKRHEHWLVLDAIDYLSMRSLVVSCGVLRASGEGERRLVALKGGPVDYGRWEGAACQAT